jgi:hypothetical protein
MPVNLETTTMIGTTTPPTDPAELRAARSLTKFAAAIGDLRQGVCQLNTSPREQIIRAAEEVRRLVDLAEEEALELAANFELAPA